MCDNTHHQRVHLPETIEVDQYSQYDQEEGYHTHTDHSVHSGSHDYEDDGMSMAVKVRRPMLQRKIISGLWNQCYVTWGGVGALDILLQHLALVATKYSLVRL